MGGTGLRYGQVLQGRVVRVPCLGATGIFVDVGLAVAGFVDVLLLPEDGAAWPAEGTVTAFEVWSAGNRPQIRLKPSAPATSARTSPPS